MQTIASKSIAADAWRAPRELSGSLPRSVRLSLKGTVIVVLMVLFLGGAVFLPVWVYQDTARQRELAQRFAAHGVFANGVASVGGVIDEDARHRVTYRYQVNGRTYESKVQLSGGSAKRLKESPNIVVRYLPDEPARSQIVGYGREIPPAWLPVVIASSLLAPIMVLVWPLKRQRYLLSEGRTARGVVTGVRFVHGYEGGRQIRILYEFTTPAGGTQKGGFQGSKRRFPEGTVITVVYDPDNPRRSARYPLELVRLSES